MKKIIALLMSISMLFAFAGCGGNGTSDDNSGGSAQTDSEYVKSKGSLIIGITDFAPMDYEETKGSGDWIGFDADMAKAFAESLGVEARFVVIEWDNKIMELDSKSLDCVWNGMTINDEVKNGMSVSNPYCKNTQVVVVPKDKADQYQTLDSVKELQFAAEASSAGEKALKALGCSVTAVTAQADALLEVSSGTSEAAVIDLIMAGAMIGEGTSYENLAYTVSIAEEEDYGVGFRKGSDLTEMLNEFFKETYSSGKMMEIAKTYGVQESIIPQE